MQAVAGRIKAGIEDDRACVQGLGQAVAISELLDEATGLEDVEHVHGASGRAL